MKAGQRREQIELLAKLLGALEVWLNHSETQEAWTHDRDKCLAGIALLDAWEKYTGSRAYPISQRGKFF